MPHLEENRLVIRVRNRTTNESLVSTLRPEQPLDPMWLAAWANKFAVSDGQFADVHHRSRQEEPLTLTPHKLRSCGGSDDGARPWMLLAQDVGA